MGLGDFHFEPMKLKVWASVIVSCAHDYVPPWWSIETPAAWPVTPGGSGNLHANRHAALGHSAAEGSGTSRTRETAASGTNSMRRPWNAPSVER